MMKSFTPIERIAILVCVVFLVANAFFVNVLSRNLKIEEEYSPEEMKSLQDGALSQVIQEMRLSLGDILWLKTDEYIHQGVMYRQMNPDEILQQEWLKKRQKKADETTSHTLTEADHELFNELGFDEKHYTQTVTVIPSREADFRGFLGDLERAMKPYSLTHVQHRNLQELIPWYRLMTWANPHHVRGYVVGAYFINTYGKRPQEAVKFLEEGERNNPNSPEIKESLGRVYFYKLSQPAKAIPYFLATTTLLDEKRRSAQLSEDEQELDRNSYISLTMACMKLNDLPNAEHYYQEAKRLYPKDRPIRDLARTLEKFKKQLPAGTK